MAFNTQEIGLGLPVLFGDMPALGTFPRCVTRVNLRERNTVLLRFIGDKAAQLCERPLSMFFSFRSTNSYSFANAFEFLNGNGRICAFSGQDNSLTDTVILMFLKACLFVGNLLQMSLGRLSASLLQGALYGLQSLTVLFNLPARKVLAGRQGGKVDNPHVDANNVGMLNQIGGLEVATGGEVESALHKDKVCFSFSIGEQLPLVVTHNKGYLLSSVHSPDRGNVIGLKGQDTVIIRLRPVLLKKALCIAVQFVGIGNLLYAMYSCLGSKVKLLTNIVINKFREMVLPKDFFFPPAFRDVITSLSTAFKRGFQGLGLFRRWIQFQVYNQFHNSSIDYLSGSVKWSQFLPSINAGESLRITNPFLRRKSAS